MPAFADLTETARWQLVAWVPSLGGVRLRVRATDGGAGYHWDLPPVFRSPGAGRQPDDAAKVELGRHLFYDTRLSDNGTFSCATCHEQELAFTDGSRVRSATPARCIRAARWRSPTSPTSRC